MTRKASSLQGKNPKHIDYPEIPLQGLLETSAKEFGEKTAIVYGEQSISYLQLDFQSNQFANVLLSLGLRKGDRVALYLPNVPQFMIAYFGTLKTGAIVTTISPLYREREITFQLKDSGAQTIVTLDSLDQNIEKIKEETGLKQVILTRSSDSSFPQFKGASIENPNVSITPKEDLAALQYTGGTTGTPKGAMLTHSNLVSNALAFANAIQGKVKDNFLTALPLFHIYGMTTSMTTPISLGAKIVLLHKFSPKEALSAIHRHQITVFCGVPTMYQMLLEQPDLSEYDLSSIRVCISGASSLPPQIQKGFIQTTGGFLAEGYGLTEASPVTHCTPVNKSIGPIKIGSIGLPLQDTEAKIVDLETGTKVLASGETGELVIKGPQVMKGYCRRPDETALVLRDGWLFTGDIARMDQDGYFYITDRKKDLIKHKGFSVYPREIEDVLYEHPSVKLCAVVGKADTAAGEIVKAFIVLKEGAEVTSEEIKTFINSKLASYKAIGEVEFRKDLPISSAGKVLRRLLKES